MTTHPLLYPQDYLPQRQVGRRPASPLAGHWAACVGDALLRSLRSWGRAPDGLLDGQGTEGKWMSTIRSSKVGMVIYMGVYYHIRYVKNIPYTRHHGWDKDEQWNLHRQLRYGWRHRIAVVQRFYWHGVFIWQATGVIQTTSHQLSARPGQKGEGGGPCVEVARPLVGCHCRWVVIPVVILCTSNTLSKLSRHAS